MLSNTGSNDSVKVKIPQGVKFVMITDYDGAENLQAELLRV